MIVLLIVACLIAFLTVERTENNAQRIQQNIQKHKTEKAKE